jgi:hypothetical protein
MKPFLKLSIFFILTVSFFTARAQQVTQTIRGTVIDYDSRMPLPGANVVVLSTGQGATSNAEGLFRIENVPVGRVTLQASFMGYEDKTLANIVVNSATEVVLNIELTEALNSLDEVVVTDGTSKAMPINEMAIVSARTFSVDEAKRYAGAIDDPARMVSAFAGVANDPEGNNDIIVRGNSPRGILWRLEGVEIPNPNHFSDDGGSGGPINALNSAMLGNSDFYTGAFAPQYGNALSGVFDMKLRTGNNQERVYSFQASTLGMDVTAEGPFSKNFNGSYLANYRYSSLALIDAAGIADFDGVPKYQDASFKVLLPINSKHSISIFGLGGTSGINTEETPEDDETTIVAKADMLSKLGVTSVKHTYLINSKAYLQTSVTASGTVSEFSYVKDDNNGGFYEDYTEDFVKTMVATTSILNYKVNARNKLKAGLTYNHLGYNMQSKNFNDDRNRLETLLAQDGQSASIQGFIELKHRLNERFSLVGGAHYLQFMLNDDIAIEPRLAGEWKINERQTLTLGAGLHSKLESVAIYLARQPQDDGSYTMPNTNLGMSKAAHFVMGYGYMLGDYTHVKVETYYQHLYNVPVVNEPGSYQSIINSTSGYTTESLVNEGTGRNYGVELTLEQYLNKGFYYMGTASLYKSLYTAIDGVERNSAFDGTYVVNALAGKEFKIGKAEKNRVLSLNTRVGLIGGKPYTPVDLEASIAEGSTVLDEDNPFSVKGDDIFKLDFSVGIRRNYRNVTTEWKIDVQNLTNNQAVIYSYYNDVTQKLDYGYQWTVFPTLSYRVTF